MLANNKSKHGEFFNKKSDSRQGPTFSQGLTNEQYISEVKCFLEKSSKEEIFTFLLKFPEQTNAMPPEVLSELSSCLTEYTAQISNTKPFKLEFLEAWHFLRFYLATEMGRYDIIDRLSHEFGNLCYQTAAPIKSL